jgi:2-polyprenyl-6-methoxyphenol hydroxylase-like FAD-dependent oxidoreductase
MQIMDVEVAPTGRFAPSVRYDVAIIGYGPTGMVLASLLGRQGHRVIVLERHEGLYNLPRAACFDDETMRLFQKLGVAEEILEGAVVQRDYQWVSGTGELLVDISYADPAPGGWAALYMMYQPHVEGVLDRLVKSLPSVTVEQGVTAVELLEREDEVVIRTLRDGRQADVAARYVIGADGGNGFTRTRLAQPLDDYDFQENWLVCDFRLFGRVEGLPEFQQVCDPRQPTSIVRIGPEHHRFSFMLERDEDRESAVLPDKVWARVSRYLNTGNAELVRVANYVFRSRIADRWRIGRLLLAGDAAHEMPPFLAQGMCSGIRDSNNLAWKLDLLLSGRANEKILDSYQPEREPHVRSITEKAIALGRIQTMRDPDEAAARDARFRELRCGNVKPDKVVFPSLSGGLIANDGSFFPQTMVQTADGQLLMDEIVGEGWLLICDDADMLSAINPDDRRRWSELGGSVELLGDNPDGLVECGSTLADWLAAHQCRAAIVRPDWYVFGTAANAIALRDRLRSLLDRGEMAVAPLNA